MIDPSANPDQSYDSLIFNYDACIDKIFLFSFLLFFFFFVEMQDSKPSKDDEDSALVFVFHSLSLQTSYAM